MQTFLTYITRIRAFSPNARRYMLYMVFFGIGTGVFRLLYNFYVLSLGYDEALLGNLITTNNTAALLAAIPMGYLADRLGRRGAMMAANISFTAGVVLMVVFPGVAVFFIMNALLGLAQSLSSVTQSPFLMENSGDEERTYLFSLSFGLQMTAMFAGNWLGGYLPTWLGLWQDVDATSSTAYGYALGAIALLMLAGLAPLSRIRPNVSIEAGESANFLPLAYFKTHFRTFGRLILPLLATSFGAGLFIPFMNVFFRQVHGRSDQAVGTLFAWSSLAMAVGFLLALAIADRMGKIQLVVLSGKPAENGEVEGELTEGEEEAIPF
jgi:MFS family permease